MDLLQKQQKIFVSKKIVLHIPKATHEKPALWNGFTMVIQQLVLNIVLFIQFFKITLLHLE